MRAPPDIRILSLSSRLAAALELMEFGILLMRQNLRFGRLETELPQCL